MKFKSVVAGAAAFGALVIGFYGTANAAAADSYYVGTTVAKNPVLWAFSPTTNLVKLCYATTANTLSCTATKSVFASALGANDNLQYRISQDSDTGGLWILDNTTNKAALCSATIPASAYIVKCVLGSGIK